MFVRNLLLLFLVFLTRQSIIMRRVEEDRSIYME